MDDSVLQFYEQLSQEYHLIFEDWRQAVIQQGEVLHRLISKYERSPSRLILDCSCGIGTQAIGLAFQGYTVHGTDLSPAAIARAQKEMLTFGVSLSWGVADMRSLANEVPGIFDVVISCDNAISHLLSAADLSLAMQNIAAKLHKDGLLIVSIRDYDQLALDRVPGTLPRVFGIGEEERIVFQTWEWEADASAYTLRQFLLTHQQTGWQTSEYTTRYRALQRAELDSQLQQVGFDSISWLMPAESGFYQPVVIAHKA